MTISYPLTVPSHGFRSLVLRAVEKVGIVESPTSFQPGIQDFGGQRWEADVELPPLSRADASAWVAFLQSLKGVYGTFLMGDPVGATPRGAWAGTPLVNGAHSAGAESLALDGLTASTTLKAADYINVGSGLTTHLHQLLADASANGSGQVTIDIWPPLRADLADNAAIVKTSAMGRWRLATNTRSWDIALAQIYGIRFVAVEAF